MKNELVTEIFESLGAASMCWEPRPTGVFQSSEATSIGDALVKKVNDLIGAAREDEAVKYAGLLNILQYLAEFGGTIESTGKMDEMNIKQARASGRMWVNDDGLGFVWMPGDFSDGPFPTTPEEVKLFENWFPLDVELPNKLKTLDWLFNKKQSK